MSVRNFIIVILILFTGAVNENAFAQIFTAKGGSFIIFQNIPDKSAVVSISEPDIRPNTFQWPANANDFIRAYRDAEFIFPGPIVLSDDNLLRIWNSFEGMTSFGKSELFPPAMLIALGQAVYVPGDNKLESAVISIKQKGADESKTLQWRDHIALVAHEAKSESVNDNERSIQLKFVFPHDSWINGARVFKMPVGALAPEEIYPMVFTTTLSDRIEMHIKDTLQEVGEFLYTIQPTDHLGNSLSSLPPVYAHNYNRLTTPHIIRFEGQGSEVTKAIRLSWESTYLQRVRGFEIYRGLDRDGPFERIASLPPSDTVFIDQVETVMRNFFYYVQILDQMGPAEKSITVFVPSLKKEKPQPPIDLIATTVENGVLLKWPILDGMYHIRGYYVYRQGQDSSDWKQVSGFIPRSGEVMTFVDSTNSLQPHKEYAYFVRAESTSYEQSGPSPTAMGRPGKTRNIVLPMEFSWRHMDDGMLMLHWGDHRKHDPYITKYHVFTATASGSPDKEVAGSPMDVNQNFWIQPAGQSSPYGYCLQAEDAWGNKSGTTAALMPIKSQHNLSPGIILAHPSKTGYKLSWGLPNDLGVKAILLYEQSEDGKSTLVQSFKPTVNMHELPPPTKDKARTFFLKWKLADGSESTPGEYVILSK